MKGRVVVGMSGGVDSSVAAWLLKEQGYDVIGVTMQIWQDEMTETISENGGCCGLSAVEDARRVADLIDIPYYVMNFKSQFAENVIENFVNEYINGRTPNPCIACNRYVKWESLLKRSLDIGADYIATGHYARIALLQNGRFTLRKSRTSLKDQTYALYSLTQRQLSKTLMPVGEYTKEEIREIALKIGLPVANKRDSQEICFVPDKDYAGFIRRYIDDKFNGEFGDAARNAVSSGNFINEQGDILGRHKGIIHYTVGQRKGLNLSFGKPVFVKEIRPATKEVVLADEQSVFSDRLICDRLNFMAEESLETPKRLTVKVRYGHKGSPATVRMIEKDMAECVFDEPVRAVTPGQAAVFYDGDILFGGGEIINEPYL